ncbi:MAG: tetratricopeptide (TPR) repeat protein [Rhodothermales bacterium]
MKIGAWVTAALGATLVIGSLKFGAVYSASGVGFFPMELAEWVIGSWPAFYFPVAAAALLGFVLLSAPRAVALDRQALPFLAPIALVFVAGLVGLINSTEQDAARQFCLQMLGLANFATAVYLHCQHRPEARKALLACVGIGTAIVMIPAWHQMSGGFQESQDSMLEMAQIYGWELPREMLIRLKDRRVYGSFTYPNSFAAHALLTVPIVAAMMWVAGRRVDPPRISQPLLLVVALVIGGRALVESGSRGAAVGLFAALGLLGVASLWWHRERLGAWRGRIVTIAVLMLVLLVVGIEQMKGGRGFRSATARFDYYAAALKLTAEYPFLGAGVGEFYPNYMRLKPAGAEETRIPHNLFLNLLCQAGIVGGLAAIIFLGAPLWLAWLWGRGRLRAADPIIAATALTAAMAWSMHSLFDFNIKTPITVALFCVIPILVLSPGDARAPQRPMRWQLVLLALSVVIGLLGIRRAAGEREYQLIYNQASGMSIDTRPMSLNEARSRVERAAQTMPHSPYPWEKLGAMAAARRDQATAEFAFSRALELCPHRAAFHSNMAQLALANGNLEGALEAIAEALRWYPYESRYRALQTVAQRLAARK